MGTSRHVDAAQRPASRHRLAAVVALLALAAAVVVAVAAAVDNIEGLVLMLIGLPVTAGFAWQAVSRRGAGRVAGLAGVLAGLALAIAGIVVADLTWWRILLLAVLAAVSVVAARIALRRHARALAARAAARVPAPPARHPVLIMNPKSGGGKAERFNLVEECHRRGIEPVVLNRGDDLLQLAEDAVARGCDVIGMAGGDGSQALVATVARKHGIPHVVVPAGTRNHLALDLGLDRDDVVGALDAFTDGVEQRVDLASAGGRVFVNNASLGVYAEVVQSPAYRDAKLRTALQTLPEVLGGAAPLDLQFTGPDGTEHQTAQLVLVSNNPYQLGHAGGRGTRRRMDRGVLGVVAVNVRDAADARRLATSIAAGRLSSFSGVVRWTPTRFEVRSGGPVAVGVDGEALTFEPPVVFETLPGALTVRLPRHATGLSPAARSVNVMRRSTAAELLRVAVGREPGDDEG